MKRKKSSVLLAVSAFVVAFGSLVLAPTASADGCTIIAGVGYAANCASGGSSSSYVSPPITGSGSPFQYVDGIPCTSNNYHTCRALQQTGNPAP